MSEPPLVRLTKSSADYFAWTKGDLVFRDATIREVALAFNAWYGVGLWYPPQYQWRHLTATLSGESAATAAQTIALAIGADVYSKGDDYELTPRITK
jgi:ferric-dicitrate binding protein FerR (iron transport regulator)